MKKRYQFFSKEGIKWTEWFNVRKRGEDIQLKLGHKQAPLMNEYKEE